MRQKSCPVAKMRMRMEMQTQMQCNVMTMQCRCNADMLLLMLTLNEYAILHDADMVRDEALLMSVGAMNDELTDSSPDS